MIFLTEFFLPFSMKRPFFSLERIMNIQDFWNKLVSLVTEKLA
jgi:hypothetical protein